MQTRVRWVYNTSMIKLPQGVTDVLQKMKAANFEAYAVGGSVRDLILGKPTTDWDFTTSATPEEILKLFPDGFYDNVFGTVGIPVQNSKTEKQEIFEITTYRSEHGYSDRRRPDKVVWGTSLEEDLARRDFTVNAIATDGKKLIDPYHGQEDIKNKLIRAVGDPDTRFNEDALRLMRAIRIATQLEFLIEEQTLTTLKKNVSLISHIAIERVRDELFKILSTAHPADGILFLKNTGLLHYILPEMEICFTTPQKSPKRHHVYDVGTHLVMSLKHCHSPKPIVRLATLLHDIGKPQVFKKDETELITFFNHEVVGARMVRTIADRLRLSKKDRELLITLVRWHQFSVDERQTDSALRRFIRRVGKENLEDMLALRVGDRLGGGARETSWRLELYKKRLEEVQQQPFGISDLKVNGNDVMEILKIKPGPSVGTILNKLFEEVEEDLTRNTREYLLERIVFYHNSFTQEK